MKTEAQSRFAQMFSPSKDSLIALSGTPAKSTSKDGPRKNKKVVIEFPKEWQEGDNGVVGEPYNSIWENLNTSSSQEHHFWAPFMLGVAVAFVLILVPSSAGIYSVCRNVQLPLTEIESLSSPYQPMQRTFSHVDMAPKLKSRGNILKRLFRKLRKERDEPNSQVNVPYQQHDPTTCACQLLWQGLQSMSLLPNNNFTSSPTDRFRESPEAEGEEPESNSLEVAQSSEEDSEKQRQLYEEYGKAFTETNIEISQTKKRLIERLNQKMRSVIPDWDERIRQVPWGGQHEREGLNWFQPAKKDGTEIQQLEGGGLFYAYLRIMEWPESLFCHFPHKLCSKGCPSEEALRHTLEWREKYQPWRINPSMKKENSMGAIFHHGFSPPMKINNGGDDGGHEFGVRHAIVWARPGYRSKHSDVHYVRAYMNTVDRAVAASFEHSNYINGKFNFVADASKFQLSTLPSLHYIKVFVTMLQDHYPDRLGMILLTNMSYAAELGTKLFLPLLSKEVRHKIKVVPHSPVKRRLILETVLGKDNIPVWLGGTDTYQFDVEEYYADFERTLHSSDEEAMEYIKSMPYHS